MPFLLDTNVISELRKAPHCHPHVWQWFNATPMEEIYISVLSLGEMRRGVEKNGAKMPSPPEFMKNGCMMSRSCTANALLASTQRFATSGDIFQSIHNCRQ